MAGGTGSKPFNPTAVIEAVGEIAILVSVLGCAYLAIAGNPGLLNNYQKIPKNSDSSSFNPKEYVWKTEKNPKNFNNPI